MIPLTVDLPEDDPGLDEIAADMGTIAGTVWAFVNAGPDRIAIWRRPIAYTHKDGRKPPPSRRVENYARLHKVSNNEAEAMIAARSV